MKTYQIYLLLSFIFLVFSLVALDWSFTAQKQAMEAAGQTFWVFAYRPYLWISPSMGCLIIAMIYDDDIT